MWLYVRYGPATVMIQRYVGPLVTCRCSCRCTWTSQPGHHVARWREGPQLPFFSAMGTPQRLPLPTYPPLLSSYDLLVRPLLPFSPSPSPPSYVASPVPPLASATCTPPSHARCAAAFRCFSPSAWEFADSAPPRLLTHSCPRLLPGQGTPAGIAAARCLPSA